MARTSKDGPTEVISFRVPAAVAAWVDGKAAEKGKTRGEYVRDSIINSHDRAQADRPPQPRGDVTPRPKGKASGKPDPSTL